MRIAARAAALALALVLSQPLSAGWWQVFQADGRLDLGAGRELALAAVTDNPQSAEAVAAALWWLANLDNLPAPEEVLAAAQGGRDPELGFVLARIEASLSSRPPAGALTAAEVTGPYGVFSILDLDREVVPPDESQTKVSLRT